MVTKEKAEEILRKTIKDNITHRDYDYVVDYAKRMRRLITGVGLDADLQQFVGREEDKMFAQRLKLTQLITPSICASLMTPYWKIPRVNPVIDTIELNSAKAKPQANGVAKNNTDTTVTKTDSSEGQMEKLKEAIANYYGGESVDYYLDKRWMPHIFIDPNSFVLTTFDSFDNRFENAKPYPTEISCEDAINFEYANNVLQWLIVRKDIMYDEISVVAVAENKLNYVPTKKKGYCYQIYADNDIIEYEQCDPMLHSGAIGDLIGGGVDEEGEKSFYFKFDNARVFRVSYYEPKAGMVQAKRVGVFQDLATDGRTRVSPLQPALPYLMKSIKAVSELDISVALHVFLQKIQYLPPCEGFEKQACNGGHLLNGEICPTCKGTGYQISTTSQDAITLTLPRDPQSAFKLNELVHYVQMPIEIVKFLDEFIDTLEKKCIKAMYNSELFSTDTVLPTATGVKTDMDSVYDSLYPTAQAYSAMRKYIYKLIAVLVDVPNANPQHKFPRDFKFRGLSELIFNLDSVSKSNAPMFIRQEINNDIAAIIFADKPDELKRVKVKQDFNPFDGKTTEEISTILADKKLSTAKDRLLWAMASRIFTEIEQEHPKDGEAWFYGMTYDKQKKIVDEKVQEIMDEIDGESQSAIQFGANGLPIDATPQGEQIPKLDANGQPMMDAQGNPIMLPAAAPAPAKGGFPFKAGAPSDASQQFAK